MNLINKGIVVIMLLLTFNSFAQYTLTPDTQHLGDVYFNSNYSITCTLENTGGNDKTFSISKANDWPTWLNISPMYFTLDNFESQTITISGTCADLNFGNHGTDFDIDIVGEDLFLWSQIWWTSHGASGIEDYISWTQITDIFSEQETVVYGMEYHDEIPYNNPIDWNVQMMLYSADGEYLYSEVDIPAYQPVQWQFVAPNLPGNIDFVRSSTGAVLGKVIVKATDVNGYINYLERPFQIRKEPIVPKYSILCSEDDEIKLCFQNIVNGATSYEIYYDTDPNLPYNGTGLTQGNSPIITNDLSTFDISGLQNCTNYYFSVKAINSYGESNLSSLEEVVTFVTPTAIPTYYHYEDVSFTTDKSINSNSYYNYYYGNLIIESGVTLNIDGGTLYFDENSGIIIKQGGKLILDGTICTSACGEMWQGIQVWGDKTVSQYPDANGDYQQGYLELKNDAMIENALVAVELWEPDNWNSMGGMIYAEDAIFRNNAKSVHALYYQNLHPNFPTVEMNYASNFENCTFEITNDYVGDATFAKHVDMSHVKGIDFQGCTFELSSSATNIFEYNTAISAYDAKFNISAICTSPMNPCPEQGYDRSYFSGFYAAVHASSDGSTSNTFSINRADFVNNTIGVKINSVNNATVLFSDFTIGENKSSEKMSCASAPGIGISATDATGFAFEENDFTKYSGASTGNFTGISIVNSEGINEVYKNNFDGLSYGNYSNLKNWELNDRYEGLAYYCNDNTSNYADFYVANIPGSGIQSNQGDAIKVAGNTFSQSGATWHFYNGGDHLVQYFYDTQNGTTPNPQHPTLLYNVVTTGENLSNSCPSHYGIISPKGSIALSPEQEQEAELDYFTNLTSYNNVEALYDNLTDGGDTQEEILDIKTAQPSDMWDLREQLLGDSPHLSEEVLKEAADRTDVFTESALFDILAANPDELKKETLIEYLENKTNPLPQYMIDVLRQVSTGSTYKTVLQQEMGKYNSKYTKAANDIIRSILSEEETDYTKLRNWLDNLGGLSSDRQIISSYIQEGNYSDAITLANMLPQLYKLSVDEIGENNYYVEMLNILKTLDEENRSVYQLNSTEVLDIEVIANNSVGIAGTQAKNILEAISDYHFTCCPETDGQVAFKNGNINQNTIAEAFGLSVEIKPNPAKDWAAFDYTLPGDESSAIIIITDETGRNIETLNIYGNQGQKLMDTRDLKPGVYIYTLIVNGMNKTGKFVVNN